MSTAQRTVGVLFTYAVVHCAHFFFPLQQWRTNLFDIANVKQLRILLPFFRTSWGAGVLNSAIL